MEDEIIKLRVGRTPLVRAENLEEELNIGKIFLKLEGNNPSGHREDRLAYLIIRDALARDKRTICMGTYGTLGGSLSFLAESFDVKCIFYVPNKKKVLRKTLMDQEHVEIREFGRSYEDCVKESRRVSEENGYYNANPGRANNLMNMYAFSYITEEIEQQMGLKIHSIFCQTSNGSSISGLHLGFKQMWVNEDIDYLPRIIAVSSAHGNAIVESFKQGSDKILVLDRKDIKDTRYNRNMVQWNCFNGQDALNAIKDTGGMAIGVTDEELLEHGKHFKKIEKFIRLKPRNYAPIAAFVKAVRNKDIKKGNHVIILNDGMVDINVKLIQKKDLNISYREFLKKLDAWLIRFTDPMDEMEEAVQDAFDNGHVICAYRGSTLVGICILSTSKYDVFFPKYHLSYIATKKDIKGMGIATQLMQKAIEVTEGNFSLHVETDNKRAIKLYEKMGLKKKYYRMFYQG